MRVILSNQAKKFLLRLDDQKQRQKLEDIADQLAFDPLPYAEYDLEKIKGADSSYRLRKGDYRIVYAFSKDMDAIWITEITRREQAYR